MSDAPAMRELLRADTPSDRGRRGRDDVLGCLDHLDHLDHLDASIGKGTGAPDPIAIR